ncbi:uncharacterized protein LOC121731461 [Aricia agestis]|uniref:uncharacterized protein LOC121731461 n=1 Tax=Aricia agestis TaxID=91739 RepID=UPI001C20716A|nr:uncharacterized protein LOC121731461 [Aricia agestis]
MKTKSFLLFSTTVFAVSIFLIIFHSQPPQSFQTIVTQTHQHIKDFQVALSGEQQREEEPGPEAEARWLAAVGFSGVEAWHNTTVPVIVTVARGDQHARVVAFVRAAAHLPYTVLVYNIGLKPYSLAVVSNYCNSSKCAVIDFDLSVFPSHVSDESITAYRPLVIQHALSRVGGVVYSEAGWRWTGTGAGLARAWSGAGPLGVRAWPRRAAVTSLTHPRMFRHLHATLEDFLFVQQLDAERLLLRARPATVDVMRAWVRCALALDCIMPIGAQSGGCKFDKKPQYRYSGCHGQDASALSIILGLRSGFEEGAYTVRGAPPWRRVADGAARALLAGLERNTTTPHAPDARTDPDPL